MSQTSSAIVHHIALACGGTGGHIFPGLATAEALRARGHRVTLWLSGKSGERESVQSWSGDTVTIPSRGLSGNPFRKLSAAAALYRSGRRCLNIMRTDPPDCVLAMGSYASYGPLYAGRKLKKPLVLHEANVLPGKAVKFFSRWASSVAASFEETRYYMKRRNISVTGMPLRQDLHPDRCQAVDLGLDPRLFTLMVMGGSRGARSLNDNVSYAVCNLVRRGCPLQVMHLTGEADFEPIRQLYRDHQVSCWVQPFTHDMGSMYLQADLCISRAGASSCAEIKAFSVPSLLVPYPHAVHDHQTVNARAMTRSRGADMVDQKDMTIDWLEDYIRGNMEFPDRLENMRNKLMEQSENPASEQLADLVELTLRKYRRLNQRKKAA